VINLNYRTRLSRCVG